jgi:hypothetical protein
MQKKFKVAVVLKSNKVLYFSERSHTRRGAEWQTKVWAEERFGNNIVSVACIAKKKGA